MSEPTMAKKNVKKELLDGQTKIRFTNRDLLDAEAITDAQKIAFRSYFSGDTNLVLTGSAGTGKTFLGMYFALSDVLNPKTPYDKLIIVRSAVQVRDIGFLSGNLDEKSEEYEAPYADICDSLFEYSKSYANLKKLYKIEFKLTSFLRGKTFDNAIILVDEAQSCTMHELSSIATRVGMDSKIIIAGDSNQNDLVKSAHDVSGFVQFSRIMERISNVDTVKFQNSDIVRSGFVKEFLIAKDTLGIT